MYAQTAALSSWRSAGVADRGGFARLALPPDRAAETEELAAVLWASVHGAADLVMSQLIPAGVDPIGERIVAQVARLLD